MPHECRKPPGGNQGPRFRHGFGHPNDAQTQQLRKTSLSPWAHNQKGSQPHGTTSLHPLAHHHVVRRRVPELTPQAQRLYFYLWTQPNVNSGGFLDLHVTKWARALVHLAPQDVEAALDELIVRDWVMVDDDTEDLWLCRWIREDAINSPLFYKGALQAIQVVPSRTLRHAAYKEVCGLRRPRTNKQGLNEDINTAFEALREVVEREGGNPFQTLPKPFLKGGGKRQGRGTGRGTAATRRDVSAAADTRPRQAATACAVPASAGSCSRELHPVRRPFGGNQQLRHLR